MGHYMPLDLLGVADLSPENDRYFRMTLDVIGYLPGEHQAPRTLAGIGYSPITFPG
jgi:hypothetical protein